MPSLAGKVAVVTGAGAGFGEAFVRDLAADGARVAVLDLDGVRAAGIAASIRDAGGDALPFGCDVADEAGIADVARRIGQQWGGVDVLVNNAGLHSAEYNRAFGELGVARTRRLFDTNVMGVIVCTLAFRPLMGDRDGAAIVNLSSVAGFNSANAYGVSKLAVRGLTVSFAQELAADGIRVNAIAPGLIATERIREDFPEEMFTTFARDRQCVHRTGEVRDVVAAMRYLCSDAASFVTGEVLRVSGGYQLSV
ncbi:SDR family NAD(P)-dependent oxidoreductase [Microbacterium sp. No. 7]|uniref:SDR family NAD(P)-dependent oxidoreductase n=1 Tax=Microbacterium sp. No. 7 TaxID=1714373 RepID=UPI0006CF5D36|nr:SDR family oxidoreductase [Microbacterium sp. No. 7]ALJ18891.1 short-chain dehydrogenase [Microbacterium sp. No. 7]